MHEQAIWAIRGHYEFDPALPAWLVARGAAPT
jgi:hypothetical protein